MTAAPEVARPDTHIHRLQAALRVSRGWVITCVDSAQARRDLKTVDAALAMTSVDFTDALMTALHAAINSPKGVVPACAERFYDANHPAVRVHLEAGL